MTNSLDINNISEQLKENNSVAFICENAEYSRNLATMITNNYNKVIILTPNNLIINDYISLFEKNNIDISKIDFKTYEDIINYSIIELNNISADCIILDQFNNIGGSLWNNIFDFIKKNNPKINILGLAPTTIKAKGDLEELDLASKGQLFENSIVYKYGLEQMLHDGIIDCNGYIAINSNLSNQIDVLEQDLKNTDLPDSIYNELKDEIDNIRRKVEDELDYSEILKRYINSNGKYLVICNDEKDLLDTKDFIESHISDLIKNKSFVSLFNLKEISQEQEIAFNNMNFDGVKFMYAVNKYNKDLNLKDLDGCFLSRGLRNYDIFENDIIYILQSGLKIIYDLGNNVDYIEKINQKLSELNVKNINSFIITSEIQNSIKNISKTLENNFDEFYMKKKEIVDHILKGDVPKLSYRFEDGTIFGSLVQNLNSKSYRRFVEEAIQGDELSKIIVKTYNLKSSTLTFYQKINEIYHHILDGKVGNGVEKFSNGQYYKVFLNLNRKKILKLAKTDPKIKLIVETYDVASEISDEDKKHELAEEIRNNGKFKSGTASPLFSDGTRMYDWQKRKVIKEKHIKEAKQGDEDAKLILKTFTNTKLTFEEKIREIVEKIESKEKITSKTDFSDGIAILDWIKRLSEKIILAASDGNENCKKVDEYYKLSEKKEKKENKITLTYEEYLVELLDQLKYCYENNKKFNLKMRFSDGYNMRKWLEENRDEITEEAKTNETCFKILDYEYKLVNEFEILKKEFLEYIKVNGVQNLSSKEKFSNNRQMNLWWWSNKVKILASNDETSKEITKIYNSVIKLTFEEKKDEIIDKINAGEKITDKTLLSNGQPIYHFYYNWMQRFKYYALVKREPKSIKIFNYFESEVKYLGGITNVDYLSQFEAEKKEVLNLLRESKPNILDEKISGGKTVRNWLRRHRYRLVMGDDPESIEISKSLILPNFKDADGDNLIMSQKQ